MLKKIIIHKYFKEVCADTLFNTFKAIGLGNSTLESSATDPPIMGSEYIFKNAWTSKEDLNQTIRLSWQCEYIYGDLWNNTIAEIAIVRNASDGRFDGFIRLMIDPISINASDIYRFYVNVEI